MKNRVALTGLGVLVALVALLVLDREAHARWYQWNLRVVDPVRTCRDGLHLGLGTFSDEDRSTEVTARLLTTTGSEHLFTFSVAELPEQEPVYVDEYGDYLTYYDYHTLLWKGEDGYRLLDPGDVVSLNYDPNEISPDTQVTVEDCLILVETLYIPVLANNN